MTKRPLSITIISWIFIVFGAASFLAILLPLTSSATVQRITGRPFEFGLMAVARILTVFIGVFMLYGFNWARWLLVVWVGGHIILSAFHSLFEVLMHSLLFTVLLYFVFRPQASAYFRGTSAAPPQE